MALSHLELDRFMVGGKSQKQAADYFGVTTRYIRKILSTPPAFSSSAPAGAVAGAPAPAAGPVDWVRLPGERGLHRIVAAPHNELEQTAKQEQPALFPTGTTAFALPVAAPAPHNVIAPNVVRVVARWPLDADRLDIFGWFLAASLGPLPLPAVLLALLLVVICGVR
jgi:hypothetical protein